MFFLIIEAFLSKYLNISVWKTGKKALPLFLVESKPLKKA